MRVLSLVAWCVVACASQPQTVMEPVSLSPSNPRLEPPNDSTDSTDSTERSERTDDGREIIHGDGFKYCYLDIKEHRAGGCSDTMEACVRGRESSEKAAVAAGLGHYEECRALPGAACFIATQRVSGVKLTGCAPTIEQCELTMQELQQGGDFSTWPTKCAVYRMRGSEADVDASNRERSDANRERPVPTKLPAGWWCAVLTNTNGYVSSQCYRDRVECDRLGNTMQQRGWTVSSCQPRDIAVCLDSATPNGGRLPMCFQSHAHCESHRNAAPAATAPSKCENAP
jgi:hypothetical protein